MMKYNCIALIMVMASLLDITGCSIDSKSLLSPNGKVQIGINAADSVSGMRFDINCTDNSKTCKALSVINLGMSFGDNESHKFHLRDAKLPGATPVSDSYQMLSGKQQLCHNQANEYLIGLQDESGTPLDMRVRVYDNGVAFRYEAHNLKEATIGKESTTYIVSEGTSRWFSEFDHNQAYERFYPLSKSGEKKRFGYPALLQAGSDCFALITESAIEPCNAASSLYNNSGDSLYQVCQDVNKLKINGDFITPWRVVMVGTLGSIVENTLVTDLAPSSRIDDTAWIQPGVCSWIYWAYNHGSNDFQIVKKYIDMASRLKLPYVLIDAEWDEMKNGGSITDAVHYADSLKVSTLLWYNSSTAWVSHGAPGPFYRLNSPENREKEFAWLNSLGVKGVKIDFFAGDTQETMAYCIDLLESAAKHHLMVNFHGATIPRGWQRTYPNLMSTEAVLGAEWYNNGPSLTEPAASHNATLPFTRNVVGSMDYTPCTFSDSQFPHITTNAHELALTVVFESGLQHLADKPESYFAQPDAVQNFFTCLPSAWDETKFIEGYPGEYVVMARRKGDRWYIGCINGSQVARFVNIDFSVLQKTFSKFTIFEDANLDDKTWNISTTGNAPSSLKCLSRGGFVIVAE